MVKFIKSLQFLFKPRYWMMNNRYSKEWDDLLNHLMDNFEPVLSEPNELDGHIYTVQFDNIDVWIANYPYAYATVYNMPKDLKNGTRFNNVRPSRLTILRLYNLVKDDKIKKEIEHSTDEYFKKILDGYINEGKNA